MEQKNGMENDPAVEAARGVPDADQEERPGEDVPKKSSVGAGYYKSALCCFILGALSILSADSGLISLWEEEIGLLLIFVGVLLAGVGFLKARGID